MKILHGPKNTGGMAGLLARAQRRLGHDAWSVNYQPTRFEYFCDQIFTNPAIIGRMWEWAWFVLAKAPRFDVFHFYFGESLCGPKLWDVPYLKRMGKRVFFYFCGCDIRDSKHTVKTYKPSVCAACWPMKCSRNRLKARRMALEHADGIFVSTPDLLEFVPGAVLLPQPIDLEKFEALAQSGHSSVPPGRPGVDRPVRLAHAPSNWKMKGTAIIVAAVERLRRRGLKVELVLVENKPYAEAVTIRNTCDLGVDQLLVGAYGQCAVEMMAMGKPTICYIRPDILPLYRQGCPIIPASADNFEEVLAEWVAHPEWWPRIGEKSKRYVREVHDMCAVAKVCLDTYPKNSR